MSGRADDPRFDPGELDLPPGLGTVTEELARYAELTNESAPPAFADHVMAAIDAEPAPRRWFAGWVPALGGPARRTLRLAAVAAVVVLAVGGALVGGELSGLLRNGPPAGSSSSPRPSPSLVPSPTLRPTPSPSSDASESASPTADARASGSEQPGSNGATESVQPSAAETARPSSSEGGGSQESQSPSQQETSQPTSSGGDH